jgi:glycosyltransferase involved in cell wall biosynthesis
VINRIVIVADAAFPSKMGGVEKWLHHLSLAINALDIEVVYLNNFNQSANYGKLSYRSFENNFSFDSKSNNRSIFSILQFTLFVSQWLFKNSRKGDIVYVHQTPLIPIIAVKIVSYFKKFQIINEWIEIWTFKNWRIEVGFVNGLVGYFFQSIGIMLSQNVITASNSVHNYFIRFYPDKRVIKISGQYVHKMPLLSFESLISEKNSENYLVLSRFSKEKNVNLALILFADILRIEKNSFLTLVGGGVEFENLLILAEKLNISSNIKFINNLNEDELTQLYLSAQFLIHLSRREGFGLVVGEAASYGAVPIIIQNPDNESVNRCKDFGLVFDSFDSRFMADVILKSDYKSLSKSAFEYFQRNLSIENVDSAAKQIIDFAKTLIRN